MSEQAPVYVTRTVYLVRDRAGFTVGIYGDRGTAEIEARKAGREAPEDGPHRISEHTVSFLVTK